MSDPLNIGSAEGVAALERKITLEQAELGDALRATLDTIAGRQVIWWLLERTHLYHLSLDARGEGHTGFAEGERSIGLQMLGLIERHCPARYAQMKEEALARSR